jgi:hypothetical protein
MKSRTNWAAARQAYVTSDNTLGEIAAQYGCSEQAIKRRSMLDRWTDARNSFRRAVNMKADAAQAESRAHKLKEWNDNDLRLARAIRGQAAKVLGTLEAGDINTLRNLASVVESTQRIGRLALGATTDNRGVIGEPGEDGVAAPRLADFYNSVKFEGPTEPAPKKPSEDDETRH